MQLIKLLFTLSRPRIAAVFIFGLISGVANTYLLTLIGNVLSPTVDTSTNLKRFVLTALLALITSVVSQLLLIRLSQDALFRLREQLSAGILSAPLEQLERLGGHRLLATLTQDVQALSMAVTAIPTFCVDAVTVLGCFVVLALTSGPIFAAMVAGTLGGIFGVELFLRRVRRSYQAARETEDELLGSFQSAVAGIKELKLHRGRRMDFMARHLLGAADTLRGQNKAADGGFAVAHGYGRLLQVATMGAILFGLSSAMNLPRSVMVTYILVTIFLAMPMQSLMQRIPDLLRGDVALAKIRDMNLWLRHHADETQLAYDNRPAAPEVRLELSGLSYTYRGEMPSSGPGGGGPGGPGGPPPGPGFPPGPPPGRKPKRGHHPPPPPPPVPGFHLGPLDLTFKPGQISFVVGGNGSGKSTLAKLIAGLYAPEAGFLAVNGERIDHRNVEWYRQNCAAVFTDFHLFDDYLGFDGPNLDDDVRQLLNELGLADKVYVQNGHLSTVALSQGQRKRLALLTALLEDRPLYLFDEWAADQEPRFREVFYTQILTDLARRGKTVIVITHDDRYFHLADQVVKLDFGRLAGPVVAPGERGDSVAEQSAAARDQVVIR